MRLGQVHGASPLAGDQLLQVLGLHLVGACSQQGFDGTVREHGAQGKAHVGRVEHFTAGGANGLGQALAAVIGRVLQALPAAFGELLVGVLEAGGGGHRGAAVRRRVFVTFPVERGDDFGIELAALFEHSLSGFEAGIFEARNLRNLVNAGKMLDVEQHVLEGCGVAHEVLRMNFFY